MKNRVKASKIECIAQEIDKRGPDITRGQSKQEALAIVEEWYLEQQQTIKRYYKGKRKREASIVIEKRYNQLCEYNAEQIEDDE